MEPVIEAESGLLGWVIVIVEVALHPLASVTVNVYVPAERLEAIALLPPLGAQL